MAVGRAAAQFRSWHPRHHSRTIAVVPDLRRGLTGITQAMLDHPNGVLTARMANVTATTRLHVSTTPGGEIKRTGPLVDTLLADHALFHLDADLRWIDLTSARLAELAEAVRDR